MDDGVNLMNILGIVFNFVAIVFIGDYGLFADGVNVHEDSSVYDLAYMLLGLRR